MVWKSCSVALLTLIAAGPAAARPANDVTTTYFADAAKTKWVGEVELTCGGGVVSFGHRSAFFKRSSDSCSPARMTPVAFGRFGGTLADKIEACHNRCAIRFSHRPRLPCTPDACPSNDALNECNASCDELGQSNR